MHSGSRWLPSRVFDFGLRLRNSSSLTRHAAVEAEWVRVTARNASIVTFACAAYLSSSKKSTAHRWCFGCAAAGPVGDRGAWERDVSRFYDTGVAEMPARDREALRLSIVSGIVRGIDSCRQKEALAARMPAPAV
jgi:hypothetical protein